MNFILTSIGALEYSKSSQWQHIQQIQSNKKPYICTHCPEYKYHLVGWLIDLIICWCCHQHCLRCKNTSLYLFVVYLNLTELHGLISLWTKLDLVWSSGSHGGLCGIADQCFGSHFEKEARNPSTGEEDPSTCWTSDLTADQCPFHLWNSGPSLHKFPTVVGRVCISLCVCWTLTVCRWERCVHVVVKKFNTSPVSVGNSLSRPIWIWGQLRWENLVCAGDPRLCSLQVMWIFWLNQTVFFFSLRPQLCDFFLHVGSSLLAGFVWFWFML